MDSSSPTERRSKAARWHRAALALCVVGSLFFATRGAWKLLRIGGTDFTIYYHAGKAVLDGTDPMAVHGFIYLPVFAVFLAPFALLPYEAAAIVWEALSLAATLWAVRRCAQLATPDGEPIAPSLWWLPFACTLRMVDSNLGYGQVNAFTFVLVLEGCVALRRARSLRASSWFAVGAAVKILPGFGLVWAALRRSWRVALAGVAIAAAIALLLPALAMGPSASIDSLASWWRQTAQPYQRGGDALLATRDYVPGQSLVGAGYRLLCATPATSQGELGPRVNVVDMDPDHAWIVLKIVIVLHFLVFALTVWKRRAATGSRDFAVEAALALTTVMPIGPLVHKAHMLWLMLAYAALFTRKRGSQPRAAAIARDALIAFSIAAIGLTAPAITSRSLVIDVFAGSAVCFGAEAIFIALLIDRWSSRDGATA